MNFLVHCPACDHLNPNCPNCVTLYHQKYWEWAMLLHQQRMLQARNPQHQMIPTVPEPNQTRGITHIYMMYESYSMSHRTNRYFR